MTGFAHVEKAGQGFHITVDIKTVNGRYLDVVVRLPRELVTLEAEVRRAVQGRLTRGRVEVSVGVGVHGRDAYAVDETVVQSYLGAAELLKSRGVEGRLDLSTLLQLPGVVVSKSISLGDETLASTLLEGVGEALDGVAAARSKEGEELKTDLTARLERLERILETINSIAPKAAEHFREKLNQRIRELTDGVVDENRLAQEIVYYAERSDTVEERTRLQAHLARVRHFLKESDKQDVGKQLDFLCQEINREFTTILSKSPPAELTQLGVDAKTETERIREQVQNVE
jgi:uncharacterized protein (TIGR00255 family)